MTTGVNISDARRVGLLWVLILGLFGVFNLVYWPIRFYQRETAPENFLAYARTLHREGKAADAIDCLRRGIEQHHPTFAGPYETLGDWLRAQGDTDGAGVRDVQGRFYRALRNGPEMALREAIQASLAREPVPPLSPEAGRYVSLLAGSLGVVWSAREVVAALPVQEQLALLRLTGNAISTNGMIGGTGMASPVDILAQSGGGAAARECTHILVRGRDYAGGDRGFHVALMDAQSGQVAQMAQFDIWESVEDAARMARFLREAPKGIVGVFVVADDASANMTPELEGELLSFGVARQACINREPGLLGLRYSFAAIGVKGAPSGTALQAWSPGSFAGYPGHPVTCGVLRRAEEKP